MNFCCILVTWWIYYNKGTQKQHSLKCYGGKYNEKKLWRKGNLLPYAGVHHRHL